MVLLLPLSLFTVTILPSKAPPAGALLARAHLPTPHSRTAADSNVLTAPTTDVFCRCLVAKNETRTYNSYYDDWSVMCVCVDLKNEKDYFGSQNGDLFRNNQLQTLEHCISGVHFCWPKSLGCQVRSSKFDPRKTKEQQALMCCVQTWRKVRIASKTHLVWRCLHHLTTKQIVNLSVWV